MKYVVEMGSGAMIYVPSFIKTSSGIQRFIGGIHRQHGDHISLVLFFQSKESRLVILNIRTSAQLMVQSV
jgi:hypothetical protein